MPPFRMFKVCVMDNRTPARRFWTLRGARKYQVKHWRTHLYKWRMGAWVWMP